MQRAQFQPLVVETRFHTAPDPGFRSQINDAKRNQRIKTNCSQGPMGANYEQQDTKGLINQLPLGELGAKAGVTAVIPAHSTMEGMGRRHLHPHPFRPARPALGREPGQQFLVFTPVCYSSSPSKAMPELLSRLLINFCWSRSPETSVSNNIIEGKEALFNGHRMKYQYHPNLKVKIQLRKT